MKKIDFVLIAKWAIQLLSISAIFFALGYGRSYHWPIIKKSILNKIELESTNRSPVIVRPKDLSVQLFPPGIRFHEVSILPQSDLRKSLPPTVIQSITATISVWRLLIGQMRLSHLEVDGADIYLFFDTENLSKQAKANQNISLKNKEWDVDFIRALPLEQLTVSNTRLTGQVDSNAVAFRASPILLNVEKKNDSLVFKFQTSSFKGKEIGSDKLVDFSVNLEGLIDPEGIFIHKLETQRGLIQIVGQGKIVGGKNLFSKPIAEGSLLLDVNLQEAKNLIAPFILIPKNLDPNGRLQADLQISNKRGTNLTAQYKIKAVDLAIGAINVGNVRSQGSISQSMWTGESLEIVNDWGKLTGKDIKVQFSDGNTVAADLSTEAIDVAKFLFAIGLGKIPTYSSPRIHTICKGSWRSPLSIDCDTKLSAPRILITVGTENEPKIVDWVNLNAKGQTTITDKDVKYTATLTNDSATGTSSGVIDYATGFKISYSGKNINLMNIKSLAGLRLEGTADLNGTTSGDSKTARADLTLKTKGLYLDDFGADEFQSSLSYAAGKLSFPDVIGQSKKTRYDGAITVFPLQKRIIANINMPYFETDDLFALLERRIGRRVFVSATGSGTFKLDSPLDIDKIDFQLKSQAFRGTIYGESFDQLQFDWIAKKGIIATDKVGLTKGQSRLRVDGTIEPGGKLNLETVGRNLKLEQSEKLSKFGVPLSGRFDFESGLTGKIGDPIVDLQGRISSSSIDGQGVQDSKVTFKSTNQNFAFQGDFIKDALKLNYRTEFSESGKTQISMSAQNWDFSQVLSAFMKRRLNSTFSTRITAKLDFQYSSSDMLNGSGFFEIADFLFESTRSKIALSKTARIELANHRIKTNGIHFADGDSWIKVKESNSEPKQLNLDVDGKFDLSLLAFLTPFLEDIYGQTNFSLQLRGPFLNPSYLGSAYIKDALIKIPGLPHAFERLNGDLILNQNKIVINSLTTRLAGGQATGTGEILLNGNQNFPVTVSGDFQDLNLNLPEGFITRGSGVYQVSGNWFPYLFTANYVVQGGKINLVIGGLDNKSSSQEIKPSEYLPKSIAQEKASPLNLDVNINVAKPVDVKAQISRIDIKTSGTGRMKVSGPLNDLKLNGTVSAIRGGKIQFRSSVYDIELAKLDYENTSADNPKLDIACSSRITAQINDTETRDYDVDVKVRGTGKDPKIILSSQPALPESDLISLLTLGFINNPSGESRAEEAGLANTSYQLGSQFLYEQLGINRQLEEKLGLQLGYSSSYSGTDKAAVHTFSLRKQWTPKFGTTATRAIGKTSSSEVQAQYKLNKNLSVIGEWEGKETGASTDTTNTTTDSENNLFGIDLEYKLEFR
jgi:translocation and assembly module TamB